MIDLTAPLDQLPDPLPIEPLTKPFDVTITPPGSKSIIMVEIQQPTPELLLDLGLDSQLETALLVLKTQLASPHIKMAQLAEPVPAYK